MNKLETSPFDEKRKKKNNEGGIYINGRQQVIEMFRYLNDDEKRRLLSNMKVLNPEVTLELAVEGLQFSHLYNLRDSEIKRLMMKVNPKVWGLALKGTSEEFQIRTLKLHSREYAKESFQTLQSKIKSADTTTKKAQEKVLGIFLGLVKKGEIIGSNQ